MIKLRDLINEGKLTAKMFTKAVNDEYDIETLDLMKGVINKRIKELQKMVSIANPRKTIKGFRK